MDLLHDIKLRLPAALLTATLVLVLANASTAHAIGGCGDDPSDPACQPWEETLSATLTLVTPAGAHVTSSETPLDCTGGCTRKTTYSHWCYPGDGCEDYQYDDYSLGADAPAGWAPSWTGCASVAGGRCSFTLDHNRTVTLGWVDVGDPTVAFSPPGKVARATTIAASGADNSGSFSFNWTVDGAALASHGSSITLGDRAEGNHTVAVRTVDPSGHQSAAVSKTIALDASAHVNVPSPPAFVNAQTLAVGYTTDSDVPAGSRMCAVNGGAPVACAPSFSPIDGTSPDGTYSYTVGVTDDVGNTATSPARSFVLDRTAPAVAFTDGPTEGQLVTTRAATLTFSAGDVNLDGVACALDGKPVACTSATTLALTKLADGTHLVEITGRDKAGNATTRQRRFTVKVDPGTTTPPPSGQTPPPGGTTTPPPVTTPSGPSRPTVLGAIAAGASWSYAATPKWTVLTRLKLKGVPKGAKVVVRCKGRGCPKKVTIKALNKRRLGKGTRIEIRITKPGYIGRVVRIVIRAKKAPSSTQLCLAPGATKPGRCA